MFTLVDSIKVDAILDRPDLGCAMLIASCHHHGITTTLIPGQTYWLKKMLFDYIDDLPKLISKIGLEEIEELDLTDVYERISSNTFDELAIELQTVYSELVLNKSPKEYFNSHKIEVLEKYATGIFSFYEYLLKQQKVDELTIVNDYVQLILDSKPKVIGFSSKDRDDIIAIAIRKKLKSMTDLPVIEGGCFTPFLSQKNKENRLNKKFVDYLVIGVGENSLPKLIKALASNKSLDGISNISYKTPNGFVHQSEGVVEDINILPFPDYTQFELDKYLSPKLILPVQTMRGCTWRKCAFCDHSKIYHNKVKQMDVKRFVEQLVFLNQKYGCKQFAFHDEELPPARAKKISQQLIDENLTDFNLYSLARFSPAYDNAELWKQLFRAGFKTFVWGMESGSKTMLDLMNKGTSPEVSSNILKHASCQNIFNLCFIMWGFPGETEETIDESVSYLEEHSTYIDYLIMSKFFLHRLSPVGQNPEKWGVKIGEKSNYEVDGVSNKYAAEFVKTLKAEMAMGIKNMVSDRNKFMLNLNTSRMMFFLMASYQHLIKSDINEKNIEELYPVMIGELRGSEFQKIDVLKSVLQNRVYSKTDVSLSSFQKKMIELSDGKLSVGKIIKNAVASSLEGDLYENGLEFFMQMLNANQGLFFRKSWSD